jgi:uncharacterized integral membrane protein
MAIFYLIVALLIAVVAVIFALQNTLLITISFFTWTITGSLSLVLLIALAIGVLIGLLVLAPSAINKTIQVSGHRKRIGALEKELDEHKAKVAELQKPKPVTPPTETPQK